MIKETEYWPMAKRKDSNKVLFTVSPCKDVYECSEIFRQWENDYIIKEMWVDITRDGWNVGIYDVCKKYVYTER